MKKLLLALFFCTLIPVTYAQPIPLGIWSGHITPPDGPTFEVAYDVALQQDTLKITIIADAAGSFPVRKIKAKGKTLSFAFSAGKELLCLLTKQVDERYVGVCADSQGTTGQLTMIPPKKRDSTK